MLHLLVRIVSKNKKWIQSFKKEIITGNIEIAPGVHVISFERRHDFIAGMVVKIALNQNKTPRIYSICSGNHEAEIHILFHIKEDGYLTPKLAALIPGDELYVSKPYGSFHGVKSLHGGLQQELVLPHFIQCLNRDYKKGKR